jgi:5-methylcytosine-specific restriction endonuclease McrA
MGKARGRLIKGKCNCGNWAKLVGRDKFGRKQYRNRCEVCRIKAWKYRKDYCEHCNKKWEGGRKFDVDHIDNDPSNNDPSNLQTLCRKCHSIKTKKDKEKNNV